MALDFSSNLVDLLEHRALQLGDGEAYTFLKSGELGDATALSYEELALRARAVGAFLQRSGLAGERVLLLYPPGLDFIVAFFGCLYAGAVAVPAYPPRSKRSLPRLLAIFRDARPAAALAPARALPRLEALAAQVPELRTLRHLAAEEALERSAETWQRRELDGEDLAFLQYTSGSTSSPRGVEVSHGNLLHNQEMIRRAFGQSEASVIVGWLPLYHDMGLIGNVLQPLYLGARCVLMSPGAFLQRPRRWLEAIDHYRATTSGGPNFAYELCLRRIPEKDREGLDLGSWSVAFNGAEPVRASTLEAFARAYAPHGFKPEAFYPCYGLAEATLLVTGPAADRPPRVASFDAGALEADRVAAAETGSGQARELAACGRPWLGQEVAIVDPSTAGRAGDGEVGEIWVRGPSVAGGYWRRPEASERTFGARLASESGAFLRTGDLGFFDGGELFVTGRLKDLVILRGRNHYPQDLELTAERAHPSLRPGCGAAFSIEAEDEERLVVVWELERGASSAAEEVEAIAGAVRQALAETHEVQLHELVLLRAGTVPKTSSGKIQRHACRAGHLAGELEVVARSAPSAEAEAAPAAESSEPERELDREAILELESERRLPALIEALRRELGRSLGTAPGEIADDVPLTRWGLDSLAAIEVSQRLGDALGVEVPLGELLEGADLRHLGRHLAERLESPRGPARGGELPAAGASEFSLSHGQRALFFLHRLAPESAAYHIAAAARVRAAPGAGGLESAALERALAALSRRHPALRTTFHASDAEPWQRVHDELAPELLELDAAGWSEAELGRRLEREADRPFDLAAGPLLRLVVFRGTPGGDVVLLALHHVVADFWSLAIVARELGRLYRQEREPSAAAALPAPPAVDYGSWVGWQRELLAGERGEAAWEYWRWRLAGLPPALELPTDRPRPPVQSYRGAASRSALGSELSTAVRELAHRRGATLFATFLAAFQALLQRYTGRGDLAVGSPTAGRARPEFAGVVGYFTGPVVLRAELSGRMAFSALLDQAQRRTIEALDHQDYPFALLAERLRPDRDASRSPLFQVMYVHQRSPDRELGELAAFAIGRAGVGLELGGLELESLELSERGAQFDLTLSTAELDGEIFCSLGYNTDLFDAATVERSLGHLRRLLAGAAERPGVPVAELPLLSAAERSEVLEDWSRGAELEVPEISLAELLGRRAAADPEAEALVVAEGGELRRLSHGELDRRANRLAHALLRRGLGPEARLGVSLERSADLVVALLAVLKAGCAYVPLDPAYPEERLALMLETSGAELLLARGEVGGGLEIPCLDPADPALEAEPATPPETTAHPGNLAWVIFTSGSTGRPKGVAIEQRSALHLLRWARGVFDDDELSGVLASTSICFDLSIFELFVPLAWGGRVILAENALALASHPAAGEVRLVNTVPSAMAELAAGALPDALVSVNLAGEPLSSKWVGELGRHPQIERVYNLYGPSEDTTYSTSARFDPRRGEPERVTIGRPIAGARARVLDRFLRPVPAGVVGELLLGGPGLARGYLGAPAASAERFVPDPWPARPGERLYRTGDLVRFLPTGELDYLGRLDHQVKVRGFRIEPGEVEAVLGRAAGVREAAVVVRDDLPGGRGLVAFASPSAAAEPAELERRWRSELETRLPRYMVPAFLAVLDELPHTPNGKIDRRALAARPLPAELAAAPFVAPRTPVEEILAGVFAELLGAPSVGVRDDFFDRGGHSLLAVRLAARVREDFGVELPLAEIFQAPTVAELAPRIARRAARSAPAAAISPADHRGPVPLSSGQRRLWFLARMQPESPAYNMPIGLELRGGLDAAALAAALGEIVRRHEVLRTRFELAAGEPVQEVEAAAARPLPRIDLSGLGEAAAAAELSRRTTAEARRPFDLTTGPLLRTSLWRLGGKRHALLAVAHHAVADGWSLEILGRELAALYRSALAGEPSPLEPLPIQYRDFALWQEDWLAGEAPALELEYWRDRLEGAPTALELATDRPRPRVLSHAGARLRLELDPALGEAVETLARRLGLTGFMAAAAAFAALLARRAGQDEVLLGSPTASRERPELRGLIGFLVNTLVLRLDPAVDESVEAYLRRVRGVALGAYSHRDLPFDRLIEELAPVTDLSRSPLFQAMILLEEPPLHDVDLLGLDAERLELDTGTSKFDLTLRLERGGERWLATAEYSTELFDATTIERLLRAYRRTLGFFAEAEGETRLAALPLLSPTERHQLGVELRGDPALVGGGETLGEIFARRAERSGDAIALALGDLQLSFDFLARRVRELAHRLRTAGIGADDWVGLFLPRSIEQIVGLLATLEAGAAYVPLDPEYPAERLRLIAGEAGLAALVTREGLLERLPAFEGAAVLEVDAGPGATAAVASAGPRAVSPGNLAWVIYTSGSTGRPKGVMVSHGSAVNLLHALESAIYGGAAEGLRVALNASLSFDASAKQWLQILAGRRLELIPEGLRLEARKLGPYLARRRIEAIDLTPGQLGALLDTGGPLPPRLLVGGEEIVPASWRRLVELPGTRAFNVYGPTECTVDTTVAEIGPGAPRLGRPVAGARLHLLDRHFEPVPLGVDAQLFIGGVGLARGYLARPGLSAERFVPDPFSERPGSRLYASGDLVRARGDGSLAFVGRVDHQVKVRGFRIELGEVEAALSEHPQVREAVVILDAAETAAPRLVAYAAGAELTADRVEELREHLRERLPKYMVPPILSTLESLPRTRAGKIDRGALPAPEEARTGCGERSAAPRGPVEEVLAGMMAEVLERDAVGIHDNFFELGGHSLLAAELVAMIQDGFQVELPLLQVFEAATVAEIAELLTRDPELGDQVESIAPLLLELAESPEELENQL